MLRQLPYMQADGLVESQQGARMAYTTKIATCCYCGARAALVLDKGRHELTCSGCGAPLHDLKRLHKEHNGRTHLVKKAPVQRPRKPNKSDRHDFEERRKRKSVRPPKRRKGLMKHLFEEAFDIIEDIFD